MLVLRDDDYSWLAGQYWILHNTSNDKQKHSQHVLLIWIIDEQQKLFTHVLSTWMVEDLYDVSKCIQESIKYVKEPII